MITHEQALDIAADLVRLRFATNEVEAILTPFPGGWLVGYRRAGQNLIGSPTTVIDAETGETTDYPGGFPPDSVISFHRSASARLDPSV